MRRMQSWRERHEDHRDMGWRHELLHWLREPADWGRQDLYEVKHRMGHRIHLVPGRLMAWMCARAERKKR